MFLHCPITQARGDGPRSCAEPSSWKIETASHEQVRLRERESWFSKKAQLPKDRRMVAGQKNKTDVYYRKRNPASALPSQGPSARRHPSQPPPPCFQRDMPPSAWSCPHLPHLLPHRSQSSKSPFLASRTFTALIYHFVQQFAFAVFSEERDSCCNLASSPKLKGSSYRISEMPQP